MNQRRALALQDKQHAEALAAKREREGVLDARYEKSLNRQNMKEGMAGYARDYIHSQMSDLELPDNLNLEDLSNSELFNFLQRDKSDLRKGAIDSYMDESNLSPADRKAYYGMLNTQVNDQLLMDVMAEQGNKFLDPIANAFQTRHGDDFDQGDIQEAFKRMEPSQVRALQNMTSNDIHDEGTWSSYLPEEYNIPGAKDLYYEGLEKGGWGDALQAWTNKIQFNANNLFKGVSDKEQNWKEFGESGQEKYDDFDMYGEKGSLMDKWGRPLLSF